MIADERVLVRNSQFLGETERRVIPRVRHRHHDVCFNRKLARQLATHFGPNFANGDAADLAVRPREVNVLEHAEGRLLRLERKFRTHSVLVDNEHFTRLDIANKFGVNQIEGAGFRRNYIGVLEFAERKRSPAERIAHGDQFALAHN